MIKTSKNCGSVQESTGWLNPPALSPSSLILQIGGAAGYDFKVKSCDLNFANSGRDTEAGSPRHLNFLKQLNKTTEMLYPYISGFKIHQGTQWVPRNTVTEQIGHTTIRNLGIASGPSFFFFSLQVHEGVMKEEHFWWILILIAMKLPFLPSVRPMRECRVGKQNFTHVLPWAN